MMVRIAISMALLIGPTMAPEALGQNVDVSPDTTVSLSGTLVGRDKGATDNQAGSVISIGEPFTLPPGADLTALDRLPEGFLFSPDITVNIQDVVIEPGDVAIYTTNPPLLPSTPARIPKLLFSAADEGLPGGVHVDAVSRESNGSLLISFDTTVAYDGATYDDEDVAQVPAVGAATKIFDGSTQGVPEGADLDGLHRDLPSGTLLVSFDVSGSVGGVGFDDEDVMRFTPGPNTWSKFYDGVDEHPEWNAADLDATSTPFDTDGDGVPDGKDNCGLLANPNQLDNGGVVTTTSDGIGTACQCGDVNASGHVNSTDGLFINQALLNIGVFSATNGGTVSKTASAPFFIAGRCNVTASVPACNATDGLVVNRASLNLAPGIFLTCAGEVFP